MPYRSLTHGRVGSGRSGYGRFASIPSNVSNSQASAINSSKGVENSGPTILNNATSGSRARTARILQSNMLMRQDAYGPEQYVTGQGKGYPNALPQTSVGSTNAFVRRAIARRAVTNVNTKDLTGHHSQGIEKQCECVANPVRNLKGEVISNQ